MLIPSRHTVCFSKTDSNTNSLEQKTVTKMCHQKNSGSRKLIHALVNGINEFKVLQQFDASPKNPLSQSVGKYLTFISTQIFNLLRKIHFAANAPCKPNFIKWVSP